MNRQLTPLTTSSTTDTVSVSLADYKAPDRVVVVDVLPLTSMMKVDKGVLARRAGTVTMGAAAS